MNSNHKRINPIIKKCFTFLFIICIQHASTAYLIHANHSAAAQTQINPEIQESIDNPPQEDKTIEADKTNETAQPQNEDKNQKEQPKEPNYLYPIGPKDVLSISVYDVPELNITIRVAEDGTISLPLIGMIPVTGLNRPQLEELLTKTLEKNYLKNPIVTVSIKEYESKKVTVIGAVKTPGSYELTEKLTLLQIIAKAGWTTPEANGHITVIRQNSQGKNMTLESEIDQIVIRNPMKNFEVFAGDTVIVEAEKYIEVFLFGQISHPGSVKLKKDGQATLLHAIAQAGGFTDRARQSGVVIKRTVNGKEIKIKINSNKIMKGKKADFILNNNDIIYVPESLL